MLDVIFEKIKLTRSNQNPMLVYFFRICGFLASPSGQCACSFANQLMQLRRSSVAMVSFNLRKEGCQVQF